MRAPKPRGGWSWWLRCEVLPFLGNALALVVGLAVYAAFLLLLIWALGPLNCDC